MKIAIIQRCSECGRGRCKLREFGYFDAPDGVRDRGFIPGPDCPLVELPESPGVRMGDKWAACVEEALRRKGDK